MGRPRCRRRIESEPAVSYFKPQGIPLWQLDELRLPLEGLEALRLKDVERLQGAEAALRMGVSRATFERVLAGARRTVAEALIEGKALRVEGGDYEVAGDLAPCEHRRARAGCRRGAGCSDFAPVRDEAQPSASERGFATATEGDPHSGACPDSQQPAGS